MRIAKLWVMLGTVILLGMNWSLLVRAQRSDDVHGNDIGYSVAAKLPNNQIDKQQSYFDLRMVPGQREKLQATIYNSSNDTIEVESAVHTAYTNTNGIIDYATPIKQFDPSLQYQLGHLAQLKDGPRVKLAAHTSKVVTVEVTMPTAPFNGVILGGWYFKRVNTKVTGEVKGASTVSNEYAYALGLKCTLGKVPAPQLRIDKVGVGLVNARRGILPEIRNVSAVIVPEITTQTEITDKSSGKVIKKASQQHVQFAPNTLYKYPVLTGREPVRAGRYHLHMVAKNLKHRWVFDRDFKISAADAQKINRTTVDSTPINPLWWALMGALVMLIVGCLLMWLYRYFRTNKRS